VCGDNIIHRYVPKALYGIGPVVHAPMEGLLHTSPYVFEHELVDWVFADLPIPIGFWRSVGHSHNAFFLESFLDEIASALKQDPVELRRSLISDEHPRFRSVLDRAVKEAGEAPEGRFHGVALHESFGSICAEVAEVSMVDGVPRVHTVTAAVDCGPVVNPDIVDAQIMGAVIFGLSAAMGARLDFENGRVVQGNFHDYPLLRMNQAPEVNVFVVETPGAPVGGIGEIGTPPIAPAVCNAIFAATGTRIRTLPILQALETA
jgi:isoquinoline 1-oxidoreductase beta subunit